MSKVSKGLAILVAAGVPVFALQSDADLPDRNVDLVNSIMRSPPTALDFASLIFEDDPKKTIWQMVFHNVYLLETVSQLTTQVADQKQQLDNIYAALANVAEKFPQENFQSSIFEKKLTNPSKSH